MRALGGELDQEGGTSMNGIEALIKETPEKEPCEDMIKKTVVCEPGSGISPAARSANALILDFLASKAVKNKYLLFISHQV